MKKKIIAILLTISMLSVTACGKQETLADSEEATIAIMETAETEAVLETESNTDTAPSEFLLWQPLASLKTHEKLRTAFEEFLRITGETGSKAGTIYYNPETEQAEQNATLYMATQNSEVSPYLTNLRQIPQFMEMAAETYTDIEADDISAPYAAINAYFEVLPDQTEGQFDGDAVLSRAQAMTLLMRATTPVNEAQKPETDADFTAKVGESKYTDFAAPMDQYSYLNTSNGLNGQSFNDAMTKGEFLALVTNYIHDDYLKGIERNGYTDMYSDTSDVIISTLADGGDITYEEAVAEPAKGVPGDMYEIFKLAIKNGYLTETDFKDWNMVLTKTDALALFIDMANNYWTNQGVWLYSPYTDPYADTDNGYDDVNEIHASKWADINGAWDAEHQYTLYAKSQGADYTDGWCWVYEHGKAAGDQPSYAVYMKEGDPEYGKIYHVGDMLPTGSPLSGTNEEWEEFIGEDLLRRVKEDGYNVYEDSNGRYIIDLDGSYNPDNN